MRLYTVYYISVNCSTCFGWYLHPSSGAQITVITASGTCQTVSATCRYRGGVGTQFIRVFPVLFAFFRAIRNFPRAILIFPVLFAFFPCYSHFSPCYSHFFHAIRNFSPCYSHFFHDIRVFSVLFAVFPRAIRIFPCY